MTTSEEENALYGTTSKGTLITVHAFQRGNIDCTVIDSDQFQAGGVGSDFAVDLEANFGVQNKNRPLRVIG